MQITAQKEKAENYLFQIISSPFYGLASPAVNFERL